ncbi:DUF930 domain-containing protein [Hoeflea sp.]|uniref:DUF930 domain-containing protein n=1 Tax=Hoeflea sp. TaxID=1940281 RepID=UPI001995F333|nr:DUF930 domain-containing protein [Hoeflea sp.]MBC7281529.1 DUF930 domain-containing protein [Hoeflea sp.]
MPCRPISLRWSFHLSLAAAFWLHALLIALLAVSPALHHPEPEPTGAVSVVVVPETIATSVAADPAAIAAQPPNTLAPPSIPDILKPSRRPAAPPDRGSGKSGLVSVTRFFSAEVLTEPRNTQARKALGQLANDEKAVQICNLEAMEQAQRQWDTLQPDFVVAYATAAIVLEDDLIVADGAALHSKHNWHALRYRCRVRADRTGVTAFSFAVDGAIPRERWEEISLPAGND